MICPKCGSQNPDAQKFCTGCGTELTAYYQQQQQFIQKQQQNQFQQQQYQYQQPYQQDAPTTPLQEPIPNFDYQQMPNNAIDTPVPAKGMGITALIMGILGMVLFCIPYIGIIFSIIGLILGAISVSKAKKVSKKNGVATAGLVLSCIAVGIDLLGFFFAASLLALVGLG